MMQSRPSFFCVFVVCGISACSSGSSGTGPSATGAGTGGASSSAGTGGASVVTGSGASANVVPGAGGVRPSTGAGGTPVTSGSGGLPIPTGAGGLPNINVGGAAPLGAGGVSVGGAVGIAGTPGASGAPPAGTPITLPPHGDHTCLKAGSGDFSKTGPYQVKTEDVDLATYLPASQTNITTSKATIFYPQPFEPNCPHPIAAWGNGTGVNGDSLDAYSFFHQNAASWGIVVISAHDPNSGSGNYHKAGIDYLLKQNADSTSKYYQKLSTRAGVGGHSQGGLGATLGASHPNVEAEVCVAGGGSPAPRVGFICLTGTKDLAEQSCTAGYDGATGPAFLADWTNGDHTSTETLLGYVSGDQGTIQMMRLYAAWYRCFLADDAVACNLFKGGTGNCGMCKDTGWTTLSSKNMP